MNPRPLKYVGAELGTQGPDTKATNQASNELSDGTWPNNRHLSLNFQAWSAYGGAPTGSNLVKVLQRVLPAQDFTMLRLSSKATETRWSAVWTPPQLRSLQKVPRKQTFVFSFEPRCQGWQGGRRSRPEVVRRLWHAISIHNAESVPANRRIPRH